MPSVTDDLITITVPRVVVAAAARALWSAADPGVHALWMAHVPTRYSGLPVQHGVPLLDRRYPDDPKWQRIGGGGIGDL